MPDIAGAFDEGRQKGAIRSAGNALAMGNYSDANKALYGAGLINEGNALAKYGQEQRDDAAVRRGINALAGQDYAGAGTAFAEGGSLEGMKYTQDIQAKTMDARRKFFVQSAQVLKRVPTEERGRAAETLVPTLRSMGYDDATIKSIIDAPKDDASLDAFIAQLGGEPEYKTVGNTLIDVSGSDPRVVYEGQQKPIIVGQGGVAIDPDTGRQIFVNPKTYAPARSGGGGGKGAIPPPPPGFQLDR